MLAAPAIARGGADGGTFRKKVIACAWDLGVFSPSDVLSNKAAFAALPIDGVRLFAEEGRDTDGRPVQRGRPMSDTNVWNRAKMAEIVPVLRELSEVPSLSHSFIGFSLAPMSGGCGRLDYRDDAAWGRFATNVATLAYVAREGGMKGLCADPEEYGGTRQYIRLDADPPFDECAALARRRGREFSKALFGEFPNAVLLSFWLFSGQRRGYAAAPDPAAAVREAGDLWPAFVEGILEGAPPQARLVDGDENSYNYNAYDGALTYPAKICANRACIALFAPENRDKFRTQILFGNAVYLDRFTNPEGKFYYTGPTSGSRLLSFDERFNGALRAADEYIWLWGERFSWVRWEKHGPPARGIAFDKDRTWDDELPGFFDAIRAATRPANFLERRFPEIRGKGGCTNLVAIRTMRVSPGNKNGRRVFRIPVSRAERYVVEWTAKGTRARGTLAMWRADGSRRWDLEVVTSRGEGAFRHLVRIPPDVGLLTLGMHADGDAGTEVEFSGIGAYLLPSN